MNEFNIKVQNIDMIALGRTRGVSSVAGVLKPVGNLISTFEKLDLIGFSADGNLTAPARITGIVEVQADVYDFLKNVVADSNTYGASTALELIAAISGLSVRKAGTDEYVLGFKAGTIVLSDEVSIAYPDHTDNVIIEMVDEVLSGFITDAGANNVLVLNAVNINIISGALTATLTLTFPYEDSGVTVEANVKLYLEIASVFTDQTGTLDQILNTQTKATSTLGKYMVGEQIAAPSEDIDEDFDAETPGALPANLSVSEPGAYTVRVSSAQSDTAPNSVLIDTPLSTTQDVVWIGKDFGGDKRAVEVTWAYRLGYSAETANSNNPNFTVTDAAALVRDDANDVIHSFIDPSQHPVHDFSFFGSTQLVPGGAIPDDTFVTHKIKWLGGNTFDYFQDGNFKGTFFSANPSVSKVKKFSVRGSFGDNNDDFFDSFKVVFLTPAALQRFVSELTVTGGPATSHKQRNYNDVSNTHYSRTNFKTGAVGGEGGTSGEVIGTKAYMVLSSVPSRDIMEYDPATDATVTKIVSVGDNPAFRQHKVNQSGTDGTDLYFHNRNGDANTVVWNKYSVSGNSMSTAAVLPIAVREPGIANGKDNLIRWFGGNPTNAQNEEYNSSGDTWTSKTKATYTGIKAVTNAVVNSDGDKMYNLTSGALSSPTKTQFEYDESAEAWTIKAAHTQSTDTRFSVVKRVGDNVFYIGGIRDQIGVGPAESKKYGVSANTWTTLTSAPDNSYLHQGTAGMVL